MAERKHCANCAAPSVGRYTFEKMPDGHAHSYKKICSDCGKYISWVGVGEFNYEKMISTLDPQRLNNKDLDFLTGSVRKYMINGWALSDRQQKWLDGIISRARR